VNSHSEFPALQTSTGIFHLEGLRLSTFPSVLHRQTLATPPNTQY